MGFGVWGLGFGVWVVFWSIVRRVQPSICIDKIQALLPFLEVSATLEYQDAGYPSCPPSFTIGLAHKRLVSHT